MYKNLYKTGLALSISIALSFSVMNKASASAEHNFNVLTNNTTDGQQNNHINTSSQATSTLNLNLAKVEHSDDHESHEHGSNENSQRNTAQHKSDNQQQKIPLFKECSLEEERGLTISPEKMALANIQINQVFSRKQYHSVYAPGEVKANGYKSYVVSARTESVIVSRHAILGEHVDVGQKLVTLFSESMAQAQADYLIASTQWQRVKKLGNKTVSESRLLQAQTEYNASYGKLIALGLTKAAIKKISNKDPALIGQYSLIAQRAGVVLQDEFSQGQRVAPGDAIMLLADEHDLWVEAKVAPNKKLDLALNAPAVIQFGRYAFNAKVIQSAHTIDPITRTRIIRLAVENKDDSLHSGMFVKVNFQFETHENVMAIPEEALVRGADGDWSVFIEDSCGDLKAFEIRLGRALGDQREVIGLEEGQRVVTQGAFFVASEIAKGGFDPHNH